MRPCNFVNRSSHKEHTGNKGDGKTKEGNGVWGAETDWPATKIGRGGGICLTRAGGGGKRRGHVFGKRQEMSMHRSLKSASKVATRRNVLKRFERIEVLKEAGKWKEGDRGRGLPKTKPPM